MRPVRPYRPVRGRPSEGRVRRIRQPRRVSRSGFTLIEVLAALTVLSVMVMLLGRLFNDSSKAWSTGTARADIDNAARSTFDFLSQEIGQAVVDDLIPLVVTSNATTNDLGLQSDAIRLVALCNKAERRQTTSTTYRDSQALLYFVSEVSTNQTAGLWRRTSEKFDIGGILAKAYAKNTSWLTDLSMTTATFDANVIAPEVIRLKVSVTTTNVTATAQQTFTNGYDSETHGLPLWMDLYLELMSAQDVTRAALLTGAARSEYIRQKARRYSGRIFFQNRQQPVTY